MGPNLREAASRIAQSTSLTGDAVAVDYPTLEIFRKRLRRRWFGDWGVRQCYPLLKHDVSVCELRCSGSCQHLVV